MDCQYFTIPNFSKWQHYKDRNPPWIKLHRDILNDYKFSCLRDASKLHLILIWVLASQVDNKIPCDDKWLSNKLGISTSVNLAELQEYGFIEIIGDAINTLADCKQSAIAETETETETEKDSQAEKQSSCPHLEIVNSYNQRLKALSAVTPSLWKGQRATHLRARWKEDKERQSVEWWDNLFDKISEMPFLLGENPRGWKADLGWIVNQENMTKILEGKYQQKGKAKETCATCDYVKRGCKGNKPGCTSWRPIIT